MEKIITENEFIRLWIEDSIINIEYKPDTIIDLEAAKENIKLLSEVSDGEPYLVLQNMNKLNWIDKKSRDFIATHPVTNNMTAWAFYSSSPIHFGMYLMYLKVSRPNVISDFFKYPEEAIEWLKAISIKK